METDGESGQNPGRPTGPPRPLTGAEYVSFAHELAANESELTPVGHWRRCEGAYFHFMRDQPGNTAAWECGDDEFSLVVAEFSTVDAAQSAFQSFTAHQESWNIGVEGSVAVTRNADGTSTIRHATDHSLARGAGWGVAVGVAVGILFPPSVLVGAVAVGAGGALVGKRRETHKVSDLADELLASTSPDSTRLIVLVHDRRRDDHGGSQ